MINLYTWRTGNGRKPIIALEELGLDYRLQAQSTYPNARAAPPKLETRPTI